MKKMLCTIIALLVLTAVNYADESADDEAVEGRAADEFSLFYGETPDEKELVAISAPKNPDGLSGYISFYYRHSDGTKTQLKFPVNEQKNQVRFRLGGLPNEESGYMRFPDGNTEYVVYGGADPFAWVDDGLPVYANLAVLKNGALVKQISFTEINFDFTEENFNKIGLLMDDEALEIATNPRSRERVENSFDWRVRTAFPKTGAEEIDKQVSASIKDFLSQQIAAKSNGEIFAPYDANLTIAGKLTRPSNKAVSVILLMEHYEQSAAHPSHLTRVLNYESPNGAALTLDKIFAKPEQALAIFAKIAPTLAREQLRKIFAEDAGGTLSKQDENNLKKMLTGFQDGFAATANNYADIGLEPTGVRIYFQEYQIAPYVFGMPTVLIPLADLADAKPNLALWGK